MPLEQVLNSERFSVFERESFEMHIKPIFALIKMPGSFVGGYELLQHAKDLVNVPSTAKLSMLLPSFEP